VRRGAPDAPRSPPPPSPHPAAFPPICFAHRRSTTTINTTPHNTRRLACRHVAAPRGFVVARREWSVGCRRASPVSPPPPPRARARTAPPPLILVLSPPPPPPFHPTHDATTTNASEHAFRVKKSTTSHTSLRVCVLFRSRSHARCRPTACQTAGRRRRRRSSPLFPPTPITHPHTNTSAQHATLAPDTSTRPTRVSPAPPPPPPPPKKQQKKAKNH